MYVVYETCDSLYETSADKQQLQILLFFHSFF
jgi:hypothetical protein